MQILGLLLLFLLEAQNGRGSRSGERKQRVIISEADGTLSKHLHNIGFAESLNASSTNADSQDAEHASNDNFNKTSPQHQVVKLELESGHVTVVMSDFSIIEATESIIVWESGVEKWDQSKSETAADTEHGVSRQALDYAWKKSNPHADVFIVANDTMPVEKEVQELFWEDHYESSILFTETAQAVQLFNWNRDEGRTATLMLTLGVDTDAKNIDSTETSQVVELLNWSGEEGKAVEKNYPKFVAFASDYPQFVALGMVLLFLSCLCSTIMLVLVLRCMIKYAMSCLR